MFLHFRFDVRNRSPGSARHYSDRTLFDEPTRAGLNKRFIIQ